MKGRYSYKEILVFAGTYISICIGSGFATGQEIMQFFTSHGLLGILTSILCMVIMSYCGASLLLIGKQANLKSSSDIFTYLCGNKIGMILKSIMPFIFFCSFIVMICGSGATMNEYYGIDKNIGCMIMGILSFVSILLGMEKIIDILGNIGPMIIIIALGISIVTIFKNQENLGMINEMVRESNLTKAMDSWWISAFVYSGLNMILAAPFLVGVGKTAKYKNSCILGGILGGILFSMAAICMNLGMLSDVYNTSIKQIPTLYMAQNISGIVGVMFSFMLIAGIYTTAVPLLWNICITYSDEGSKKFKIIASICTVIGILGGKLPFAKLVNIIYPLSGMIGVLVIIGIVIKNFSNRNMKYR